MDKAIAVFVSKIKKNVVITVDVPIDAISYFTKRNKRVIDCSPLSFVKEIVFTFPLIVDGQLL